MGDEGSFTLDPHQDPFAHEIRNGPADGDPGNPELCFQAALAGQAVTRAEALLRQIAKLSAHQFVLEFGHDANLEDTEQYVARCYRCSGRVQVGQLVSFGVQDHHGAAGAEIA